MYRFNHIKLSFAAIAVLLPVIFFSGCSDVHPEQRETQYILLTFTTREIVQTRSNPYTGGTAEESRFSTIQVWAFNSGQEQQPIGYKAVGTAVEPLLTDAYGNVSIIIPLAKERLSASKKLDLYIAANASEAGVVIPEETSRETLEQATVQGFSPERQVHAVPPGGLPMSRVVKSVDVGRYLSAASNPAAWIEIPLVRAVSKLLFVIAQPEGLTGASIHRIVLEGNSIAQAPYLFPPAVSYSNPLPEVNTAHIKSDAGYHNFAITYDSSEIMLNSHSAPEQYVLGVNEDLQDYVNRLSASGMTASGLIYLKESDQPLSGTIYYTTAATGTQILETSFRLDAGKFIRNREWIIYAYFTKDRLYVHPIVADWNEAGNFSFDWHYTNLLTNLTGAENTRILESGGQEYVMAAYGKSYSGLPYSPKLQLEASCSGDATAKMVLNLDNPDFGFIIDDGGVLSPVMDLIEIDLSPDPVNVIFYVTPKRLFDLAGSNPENPVARLRLFLTSGHLASIRLPFNTIPLPGDTDYILYHYVTPDKFR